MINAKLLLTYIKATLMSSHTLVYWNETWYINHNLIIIFITICHSCTEIRKIRTLKVGINITLNRNFEFDGIRSISWCTKKHSSVYAKYAHIWCWNCSFYVQEVYELNGSLVWSQAYQLICYAVIWRNTYFRPSLKLYLLLI